MTLPPIMLFNLSFDTHHIIMAVVEVTVNKPLHCVQLSPTLASKGTDMCSYNSKVCTMIEI